MASRSSVSPESRANTEYGRSQHNGSRAARTHTNSLVSWTALPAWQQDESGYVERGYRRTHPSIRRCLHTLTYLHNETVNIYSHGVGALLFIVLHVCFFASEDARRYRLASSSEVAVISIYFVSVTIALFISAVNHTCRCHSERALSLGQKLDFQGLVLVIWGATVPLIYYAFVCSRNLQVQYWAVTSVAALVCTFLNWQLNFRKPHVRPFMALGIAFVVLCFFSTVVHSLAAYGLAVQIRRLALQWIVYTLICHTFCASAYATDFPERFFPRTFDILGASHQILHVMLLAGAIAYVFALSRQFEFLHGATATCIDV